MTHEEARDLFTSYESWGLSGIENFRAMCAAHGVAPVDEGEEEEWFGHIATRLWDALSEDDRDAQADNFAAYYSA